MISPPPSEVILPPLYAVVYAISLTSVVINSGTELTELKRSHELTISKKTVTIIIINSFI